jgi:hypothetical protein
MHLPLKAMQAHDWKSGWPAKSLRILLLFLFVAAVFSVSLVPINSHDFWWHLKTGEYILQFHTLPDQDPFTYTSVPDDPDYPGRPLFVLRQFWLAQVAYALVNNAFGLQGIIVARGLLYVAIALLVLSIAAKGPAPGASLIPLALFCLATRTALEDSDRPQLFSFLLSLLLVAVIEWAIRNKRGWPLFLNVPIMFIASNMHGGYIVGAVFLAVYAVCAPFEERLRTLRVPLVISSLLAILVTYFNPNHWRSFEEGLTILHAPLYVSTIMEFDSPLTILPYSLQNPGWLAYWTLAVLSVPAALNTLKRGRYSAGALLLITLSASLFAMRFMYFFIPLGSAFVALSLQEVLAGRFKTRLIAGVLAIALFLLAIFFRPDHPNNLGIKVILREMSYPVSAADFIAREDLPRPVFNEMMWGGYLEWRLWPGYKMFVDTRQLINRAYAHYRAAMYGPDGMRYLNEYGVATVITPAIEPYTGQIIPLVRNLYLDNDWSLVYRDGEALVFVRKVLSRKEIPKKGVYEEVLSEVWYWRGAFPWIRAYEDTLAEAQRELGVPFHDRDSRTP